MKLAVSTRAKTMTTTLMLRLRLMLMLTPELQAAYAAREIELGG